MSESPLVVLKNSLPALIARMDHALHAATPCTHAADDPMDVLDRQLDALGAHVEALTRAVNEVLSPAMQAPTGDSGTTRDALRTFERTVDDLLFDHGYLRRIAASTDEQEALDLLTDAYRHAILQIRGWLAEVLKIASDPAAALRERGRDPDAPGVSEIELVWRFDSPPRLGALRAWIERRGAALEADSTDADGSVHGAQLASGWSAVLEVAVATIVGSAFLYLFIVWPGALVMTLVVALGWLLWLVLRYPLLALVALLFGVGS